MIDPFHLEAYGQTTVNYNRDIEIFPVLNAIFEGIYGENFYKSPTDMGVNMAGKSIFDDEACREASNQEIIRRYYQTLNLLAEGKATEEQVYKLEMLMNQAKINTDLRKVTVAAKERLMKERQTCAAIELNDGTIITSSTSDLFGACAALLLNALKYLAGIDHSLKIIPKSIIEPIQKTKIEYLTGKNPRLHTDELLVALSILSTTDQNASKALQKLPELKGSQVHTTVMLSEVDRKILKKLGIDFTCEPVKKEKFI